MHHIQMSLLFLTLGARTKILYLRFKARKQPKQGKKSNSVVSHHDGRIDRFGVIIKKGGKQKITFRDQVTTEKLVNIHKVQSYKKYNILTVKEQGAY
mmetsp:Transcript_5144/g.5891  ORF Transcript_5144/g.5891 Transcript_5144/m.5891 type:complete len:97 (+) Transcript_5144:105-395(+)